MTPSESQPRPALPGVSQEPRGARDPGPEPFEIWNVWESGAGNAAANMAWDEALLLHAAATSRPVLRFYGWTEPAASFGYFQRFDDVARQTPLRPIVRRPTGGGLVPHDADWTYAVVFPAGHPWYALRAEASYLRLHRWLQAAFARLGIETRLAAEPRQVQPGCCFEGYERNDLLWQGRKLAGAAQRRTRAGLLIQGSVQPPPGLGVSRTQWHQAMLEAAREVWSVKWESWTPPLSMEGTMRSLLETKYGRPEYHQRR